MPIMKTFTLFFEVPPNAENAISEAQNTILFSGEHAL
jgi:hypothetical protein